MPLSVEVILNTADNDPLSTTYYTNTMYYTHDEALAWANCRKFDSKFPYMMGRNERNQVIRNHGACVAAAMGNSTGYLAIRRADREGLI